MKSKVGRSIFVVIIIALTVMVVWISLTRNIITEDVYDAVSTLSVTPIR